MYLRSGLAMLVAALLLAGCGGDSTSDETLCFSPSFCGQAGTLATGLVTIESGEENREFYIQIPANYSAAVGIEADQEPLPLVFAFHGTTGTYNQWLDGTYDLGDAIGNEAIIVYPQALPNNAGSTQWDFTYDLQFFEDMLNRISRGVRFDTRRVFAVGHSNGAGMAHELGCKYGDIIRAIAPHAGILKSFSCVGAVAVFQTHSIEDTLVRASNGETGHAFWVAYNGLNYDTTIEGTHPTCIDHGLDATDYPVEWCLHNDSGGEQAHDWPGFGSAATWAFFKSLSIVEPTAEAPAGGGNSVIRFDALMTFTIEFPPGIGEVTEGALSIYPAGTQQPVTGGPDHILSLGFDPGNVGAGSVQTYEVPITYGNQMFPGTYAFSVAMYVADGGNPIPTSGKDMLVFQDVTVTDRNTPVVIPGILLMELVL